MRTARLAFAAALAAIGLVPAFALAAGPPFPDPVNDQAVYDTAGVLEASTIARTEEQMDQIEAIADCVVVGQHWKNDTRVILFVQMAPGKKLDEALCQEIRRTIRVNASPRHVPAKIIAVPEVPYTLNMKKVELAVRKVIHGEPVTNKDALRNPEALDDYADLVELQED